MFETTLTTKRPKSTHVILCYNNSQISFRHYCAALKRHWTIGSHASMCIVTDTKINVK